MLSFSELESNRFSLNIHRGVLATVDMNYLKNYIDEHNPDILIIRIKVEQVNSFYQLANIEHYQLLFTDALVYYVIKLTDLGEPQYRNSLDFELVTNQNKEIIKSLVPEIFFDYTNHYSANPILPKEKITEGYLEWAQAYVNESSADRISWLVRKQNDIIGFATCSMDEESKVAEGVLYGVRPSFSGGGVYTDIIKFTKKYFADLGYEKMKVSTQLQNFAVQKVWAKEGFLLDHAFYTFHLNNMSVEYPKIIMQ